MANCVIIGNNGGSSSDVNIISQEEWDAMSFNDKKSSGIVIVGEQGDTMGQWYNFTNATAENEYLPYTNSDNILTFANLDNFDDTSLSWGSGTNPIILQDYKSVDTDTNSVSIDVKTSGYCGYVDLGSINRNITIYTVMKIGTGHSSGFARHLSAMVTKSSGQGMITYGNSVLSCGTWANAVATSVTGTNFYVMGMSFNGTTGHFNFNGNTYNINFSVLGQYLTIARSTHDGTNSGVNEEPSDVFVKFLSVIDGAESNEVIAENIQNLMTMYNIS